MLEEEFYNFSVMFIMFMGFCFLGYKNGVDVFFCLECVLIWYKILLEEI